MNFLMVYPNHTGNQKVSLGIVYLLTILKNSGHSIKLFDMTFYGLDLEKHDINIRGRYLNFRSIDLTPYGVIYQKSTFDDVTNELINTIKNFKPEIIGLPLTEDTCLTGIRLAEIIKKHFKQIIIICGGPFCMTRPEYVIANKAIDIVCVGEGEECLSLVVNNLEKKQSLNNIPGIWFKNKNGKIIKNEVSAPISLDKLPYMELNFIDDRHFFSPMAGHVYKMIYVQSIRGCPRRCTYCCNQIFLNRYKKYLKHYFNRKMSIPRLIDEFYHLKHNFGFNFFQIIDDDFVMRPLNDIVEFHKLYIKKINLPFWIQAEANNITDEKIRLLKEAGCIAISIGIETGSDYILKKIFKRHTDKNATIKAFEIMHKYGIRTSGNVIIGVPNETRENIFETIELVRQCKPCSLNINIFAPYYGTQLRDYCVKSGFLQPDFIRDGKISWQAVLDMPQISKDEINGLARTFVLYATLPKKYWKDIEKCEKFSFETDIIFEKLEKKFWEIADKMGIDYHVPEFDYDSFFKKRQNELIYKNSL